MLKDVSIEPEIVTFSVMKKMFAQNGCRSRPSL
jgi:hypothetical protein